MAHTQSFFLCVGELSLVHPYLPMVFIITVLRRIGRGILSKLFDWMFLIGLFSWDFSLAFVNMITFKRKVGRVTPKGQPGEGGVWPEYSPPREGDSRCGCPALNAMANHGLLLFLSFISSLPMVIRHTLTISFLNRFVIFPARYHPTRWTRYLFPRDICTTSGDLQFLSFLRRFRASQNG
jgi:hypothetical protein